MTSTYQTENFIQTYLPYIYLVYFFVLHFSFIQNMISAFDTFIYDFSGLSYNTYVNFESLNMSLVKKT